MTAGLEKRKRLLHLAIIIQTSFLKTGECNLKQSLSWFSQGAGKVKRRKIDHESEKFLKI